MFVELREYLKSGEFLAVRRMNGEIVSLHHAELSEIKKIGLPNRQTLHPNRVLTMKATSFRTRSPRILYRGEEKNGLGAPPAQ